MALKHSVTADEFTALPEAQQGLYQAAGDSYTLDVEDDPRVGQLTAKVDEFAPITRRWRRRLTASRRRSTQRTPISPHGWLRSRRRSRPSARRSAPCSVRPTAVGSMTPSRIRAARLACTRMPLTTCNRGPSEPGSGSRMAAWLRSIPMATW